MTRHSASERRDKKPQGRQDTSVAPRTDAPDTITGADANAGDAFTRGILDSVVVGVVRFSRDRGISYANAFARQMLSAVGVHGDGMELAAFQPYTIWPDGSPCPVEEYPATKCFATGTRQGPTTLGLRDQSGTTIWVTISVVPTLDASGEVDSVIATFVDVTSSRETEESLRQSEDRYRRLVEEAPDAIVVHQEMKIVYVNRAGVKLWGGESPDDLIGRSILEFVEPSYREMVARRVDQVNRGVTAPLSEQTHVRRDGSTVRVEVTGMPCIYDGKPSIQTILRDVTQVRRQQEILAKFFDHIPLLVGIFGVDGHISQVNSEWRRVLGSGTELSLEELLERCYPDLAQRKRVEEFVRAAPAGWIDSQVRVGDGSALEMSTAIIELSDGTRIGMAKDITDQKLYEAELQTHKAELEQRVAARTEELVRKNEELQTEVATRRAAEAALQDKQLVLKEMLATHERYRQLLAYEIHDTFLQDVVGGLMYLDSYYDGRVEAADAQLELIEKAQGLMRKSIDGARRMISGLRPPIIDERGVVAAVEYLVSELNTEGMEIQLDHDVHVERLPAMLEGALFRIVQEALTNVGRHSGTKFAQVKLQQFDHTLRLEIRDFGVGFDPDAVGEGHFGLRGIAERTRLFGGKLSVRSTPGEGTEIVVELPLAQLEVDAADAGLPGE